MGINLQGITGKQTSSKTKQTSGSSSKKGTGSVSSKSASSQSDSVNLTGAASLIQKAEQALENVPLVDVDHVDDVSKRIANGQYEIDDKQIAEKLIDLEKNLS